MARRTMTREIAKTTVKVASIEMVDGKPELKELPDQTFLGNITQERAQRMVEKSLGKGATVLGTQTEKQVYEMDVKTFMEHATVKEDKQSEPDPDGK